MRAELLGIMAIAAASPGLIAEATAPNADFFFAIDVAADGSEKGLLEVFAEGRAVLDGTCVDIDWNVVGATSAGRTISVETERNASLWIRFPEPVVEARIELARSPAADGGPVHTRRVSTCSFGGGSSRYLVSVPLEGRIVAASAGATSAGGRMLDVVGADHRGVSYTVVVSSAGVRAFDEGPFLVVARTEDEEAAREVVAQATPFAEASWVAAGLRTPWARIVADFTSDEVLTWEAGQYRGNGVIVVHPRLLTRDAAVGYPHAAIRAVVHEAFHAVSVPNGGLGPGTSWFVEGAAGHAELKVSGGRPETIESCVAFTGRCWLHPSGMTYDRLYALFRDDDWAFDPSWSPDRPQADEGRALSYAYSQFLVHAFVDRYGEAAYARVWAELAEGSGSESCACDREWLDRVLRKQANANLSYDDLYHPYRSLLASDEQAFRDAVAPLVIDAPGSRVEAWLRGEGAVQLVTALIGGGVLLLVLASVRKPATRLLRARRRSVALRARDAPRAFCSCGAPFRPDLAFCPRCGRE